MKDFDETYDLMGVEGEPGNLRLVNRTFSRRDRLAAERSFKLNGETFTYRAAVAPEEVIDYYRMINDDIEDLTEPQAQEIIEKTILTFLEPGQEDTWRHARRPNCENPITIDDMRGVMQHLFAAQTGRPTGRLSGSSNGSRTTATETPSTAGSSLQEAEVSGA